MKSVMLTFPDSRQGTIDLCGIACIQAIMYYYGRSFIQSNLVEMTNMNTETGIEPEQMVAFFKEQGLETYFGSMTIEDVKSYIDKGIPVVLLIQAWVADYPVDYANISEEGHYVVAIGYDDEKIIFDDPALMANRGYISYEELLTRWRMYASDGKTVLNSYGIAVWGRRPWFRPEAMFHIDASVKRVATRWSDNKNDFYSIYKRR
jgi:ABC-type bacteriocin/lantibiotic exporter with double-glycine peptidase domain